MRSLGKHVVVNNARAVLQIGHLVCDLHCFASITLQDGVALQCVRVRVRIIIVTDGR
jgi:hypothetical protein